MDLKKREEEILKEIRNLKIYESGDFNRIYYDMRSAISQIVDVSKVYIIDNYKKITDYSDLNLILYCGTRGKAHYFGKNTGIWEDETNSSIPVTNRIKSLILERTEIKSFDLATLDFIDGDFSIKINGTNYPQIDENSIVDIASYIEEKLKNNTKKLKIDEQ